MTNKPHWIIKKAIGCQSSIGFQIHYGFYIEFEICARASLRKFPKFENSKSLKYPIRKWKTHMIQSNYDVQHRSWPHVVKITCPGRMRWLRAKVVTVQIDVLYEQIFFTIFMIQWGLFVIIRLYHMCFSLCNGIFQWFRVSEFWEFL